MTDSTTLHDRLAVLTSGGDAPGMNPALRAVVRTALDAGVEVVAVTEGFRGLVVGGSHLRPMDWDSVGGILHRGGTIIGTARCNEFRDRDGRLRAVENLVGIGVSRMVVIGGDGSLTAAELLYREWPELLDQLVREGRIAPEIAERHPHLALAGLVGSIDNDMVGTDMTIGADTALHRITEAIDAIISTASSHQRTFVVEVMGRRCGYLAVMSALATGADWVVIPEKPPEEDDWQRVMSERLQQGRRHGKRDSIVIVAEGAQDRHGNPITAHDVKAGLEHHLGEEVRVTVLGHVQRGGSPSAFDRYMSTLLGHAAVVNVLAATNGEPPQLIGMRHNRITHAPLAESVAACHAVTDALNQKNWPEALRLRGNGFNQGLDTLSTLIRSQPNPPRPDQRRLRLAILTSGGPAPGMNTAVRAAVRLGLDRGHVMLGVRNGFEGLIEGDIENLGWMSVAGWASAGGSDLGTNRRLPESKDFYAIARNLEEHEIDGLLVVAGWTGYEAAWRMHDKRDAYPAFNLPIVCLPATIDNNLPGSEIAVGADTALNSIVGAVDKIKQSAVASRRCFVVEVMGRHCGFLALMSGLATGAERVYLHEEGVTLVDLQNDLEHLIQGFSSGKRLGLMIRNEYANSCYSTGFMTTLFAQESKGLFDVRQAILGHLQQGGNPTPFDRIQATRMARRCIEWLVDAADRESDEAVSIGTRDGTVQMFDLEELPRMVDISHQRPVHQWWMDLRPIARIFAQPAPMVEPELDGD
jgi:6-phosphofructokinase 1